MSAPFFAVYMLKELGFSYLTYTVITMTATLSGQVAEVKVYVDGARA